VIVISGDAVVAVAAVVVAAAVGIG